MNSSDNRGVSPVIATVLMVAIVVIISASIGVAALGLGDTLMQPQEPRVFSDATVTIGPEHRSWSEWNSSVSDAPRGDIDTVRLTYTAGPTFEGDEVGSILVRWEGSDGEEGQVRFLNPNLFGDDTEQEFHSGEVAGEFCTGDFAAGEALTVRMAHNRYQSGGQTDPEPGGPYSYVESNQNDIARSGDEPFFRVNKRYPIEFSGDRPMKPGDSVEIRFLGVEEAQPITRTTAVATAATGDPTERDKPKCP